MERLGHARLMRALADARAEAIVDAVGDDRPAVIGASADYVDLVAALRPVLVGPQLTRLGVQRRALDVAVAEREFLGLPAGLADEGIVLRHAPVIVQADDGARMIVRPLRAILLA